MIVTPQTLASKGLVSPCKIVWRVRFTFTDGSCRVVCVSPGKMSEEEAVSRACGHAKIFDQSIIDVIEAEKVERGMASTPFGLIKK